MLAIVLAALLWGTTGTAASFLPAAVSPLAVGAATMGVGGALLFAVAGRHAVAVLRDRAARGWLLLGALGVVAYPLAFYAAMDAAGVAVGNVVSLGSAPVFAALLELLVERRRLGRRWLVATGLAVGGVALLGAAGGPPGGSEHPFEGILLGLVAGASYALYTYASERALRGGHPSRAVMGGMFGMGAVPLLVLLFLLGAPLLSRPGSVAIAAYLAIGPMFVAYLLFGRGLRTVGASTATTVTLLEPLVATLLAVVVVGERLPALGWLGLAAILAGIAVLALRRGPRRST
ncbi:DMT family transporter [Naasia aerilata]|uniref:Permease n=1 Tax=Naasia aerilata TaxID=1162966 RepID=A0ABM8GEM3_9MICO|nr:EamA family transporter [Naasia aerilata]BDZ46782.1 permease [Naasia aerilata]